MNIFHLYSQLSCLGFNPIEMFAEQGKYRIIVYFNSAYFAYSAEIIFSMFCEHTISSVVVKAYLCDCDKEEKDFDFAAPRSFSGIRAKNYASYSFALDDFVVVLSDRQDIKVLEILKTKKINHITLTPFVRMAKDYTMFIKPLLKLQRIFNIYTIVFKHESSVWNIDRELTDNEKNIRNMKYLWSDIVRKKIPTSCFSGFEYDTPDGIEEILHVPNSHYDNNGVIVMDDFHSNFVNVEGGLRRTCFQIENPQRRIFVVGGCGFYGLGVQDSGTITSVLQRLCNETAPEEKFNVYNYAMFFERRYMNYIAKINALPIGYGDIIVIRCHESSLMDTYTLYPEFQHQIFGDGKLFKNEHDYKDVFIDDIHLNENGVRGWAEAIFKILKENDYFRKTQLNKCMSAKNSQNNVIGLSSWLDSIKSLRNPIGSIVMNCNPFTLGHRYLIEYAAARCLHLYIFVVEEDKSVFPFNDRYELVKQGTSDLPNVTVLPSGQFIISQLTFTDYFGKSELQDKTIDPTFDVELFAEHIAPTLGINVRFAGEEPLDKVTLQYNQAMSRIFPKYGVDFIEIPRKESNGAVISASRVRALLKENDFEEIKKIVPETTLSYLMLKYGNRGGGR